MRIIRRRVAIAIVVVALAAAPACVRTTEGVPVAVSAPRNSSAAGPTTDDLPPGIASTTRAPVPADAVTCSPPVGPVVGVLARIDDPAAPQVTVAVPQGWGMSAGSGEVGARLSGPDGALATVTIVATRLDPKAAFREYTDQLLNQAPVSVVSILPAELCGYSGQKLTGSLSDENGDGVDFVDRIVHVWTNAGDYVVAVHAETPTDVDADEAATAMLTDGFEIRLP